MSFDHRWKSSRWLYISEEPDGFQLSGQFCADCGARRVYVESSQEVLGGKECVEIARALVNLWNAGKATVTLPDTGLPPELAPIDDGEGGFDADEASEDFSP